jgi:hypothetical protein
MFKYWTELGGLTWALLSLPLGLHSGARPKVNLICQEQFKYTIAEWSKKFSLWLFGQGGGDAWISRVDDTKLVYCFVPVKMQTQIHKRSVSVPAVLHPLYFPLLLIKISPVQLLKKPINGNPFHANKTTNKPVQDYERIPRNLLSFGFLVSLPGRASCHTGRRKTRKEGRELAIGAVQLTLQFERLS